MGSPTLPVVDVFTETERAFALETLLYRECHPPDNEVKANSTSDQVARASDSRWMHGVIASTTV